MRRTERFFGQLYSGDNKLSLLDQRYLPRWIVVVIDAVLVMISVVFVYFILLGTPITFHDVISVPQQGIVITAVSILFFFYIQDLLGDHSTLHIH